MSMRFIALPETAESGTPLEVIAEYEHEPVLGYLVMDFSLVVKKEDGSIQVVDQKNQIEMSSGKTVRLEGDITVPNNKFNVVGKAETDYGPVSNITQTIDVSDNATGCSREDFNASEWAKKRYPKNSPTVVYGNGDREHSDTLYRLMTEDNTNYELQVDYSDVLAIEQTSYTDQKPPERSYEQQVADWKRGILKSRVPCSKDGKYYWVVYSAELVDLGGGPSNEGSDNEEQGINTKYLAAGAGVIVISTLLAKEFSS